MRAVPRRLVACVVLWTVASSAQSDAADPTAIWEAFRHRQAAAETAKVVWSKQRMIPAARMRARSQEVAPADIGDLESPSHRSELILAGERVRYETSVSSFRGEDNGTLVPRISAYDGERIRSLTNGDFGGDEGVTAFDEWGNVHLIGPVFNLRPLHPEAFGPDPNAWLLEDRPAVVAGRPCLVIARRQQSGILNRVYLDPARDYVPLRYESTVDGRLSVRADMRYERTEAPTWMPSSWTSTFYRSSTSENELEEVTLGLKVPDETFMIAFPVGAEVVVADGKRGSDDRVERRYVVAEKGELIPRREAVAEETSTATVSSRWPLILAAVGAAALGVALLLWRRYSRAT
ncbi:MAG: hypothetical protein WBC44_00220 [Planctomycetaceae bacterium]